MSLLGGIVGAVGSFIGGREQRDDILDAQREQQAFLREGQERFMGTPVATTYMPGGANAFQNRQALLGLGGDEGAAREAFNNYLGSTDYNFRMRSGRNAITGSRAARGILNSGRTGTALTDFGQELGSRYMDRYLGNLAADSQMGLQAGQTVGNVLTGTASQMATGAANAGAQLAASTGNMYSDLGAAAGRIVSSGAPQKAGARLMNRFFG